MDGSRFYVYSLKCFSPRETDMKRLVELCQRSAVSSVISFGVSVFLVTSTVPRVFAAAPAKPSSEFLHDGAKTVNPFARSAEEINSTRESMAIQTEDIRLQPREPEHYIARGESYLKLQRPNEAFKDANTALSLMPQRQDALAAAYYVRGEALLQQKQYKQAISDLDKACSLDPNYGEPFYFRAVCKDKLGQVDEAIKDYELARKLSFKGTGLDCDYSTYMEDLQRRIKRCWFPPDGVESKRVVVVFKVARDGSLSHLRVYKSSGVQLMDAAAIKAIQNAAPVRPLPQGSPRNLDILFTLDYNVFDRGERASLALRDAEMRLAEATKRKDSLAIAHAELQLAHHYTNTGKYVSAIELYQKALKRLEGKPEKEVEYGTVLGYLGINYSLQGKNAEAETEFKKSLQLIDKDGASADADDLKNILKAYAKVLYKTNRVDEANKIYARLKK